MLKSSPLVGIPAGQVLSPSEVDASRPEAYTQILALKEGDYVFNRINGKSWQSNPDISLDDLRYVKVLHYNAGGQVQVGELVVNKAIQQDVTEIFEELFRQQYPIGSIHLIDDFWSGDAASSAEFSGSRNNTTAFCYQPGAGSSARSRGLAVELNPQQKGAFTASDAAYRLFTEHGFTFSGTDGGSMNSGVFVKNY